MLHMAQGLFCGGTIILQINLKTFRGDPKVRVAEVKLPQGYCPAAFANGIRGTFPSAAERNSGSHKNVDFLLQRVLGQILLFFRIL